jgi:ribulose-phosphate 3-epimerase
MDNLEREVRLLEESGIDRFHLDVMDGVFVPNFSLGAQDIEAICRLTSKKTEAHLMITDPGSYVGKFAKLGVDIIYTHPEADYHPSTTFQKIAEAGAKPGLVLNPGTSVESVKELLHIVEHVLVMSVNPGHAGQIFLPYVDKKVEQLIALKDEYGFEISMDGGCSFEQIVRLHSKGVKGFVLGTAALFGKRASYLETVHELRKATGETCSSGADSMRSAPKIRLLAMDVDGTLTDGKIYMGEQEEVLKAFDIKDGYAIHELLPQYGIIPVIVTGRESKIVENRAKELAVSLVYQNVSDKISLLKGILSEQGLSFQEAAFIGDDMSDLDCLKACGLSGCPSDAAKSVKSACSFISGKRGGEGAVREFIEYIIERSTK